jgi:hypothetical protein
MGGVWKTSNWEGGQGQPAAGHQEGEMGIDGTVVP